MAEVLLSEAIALVTMVVRRHVRGVLGIIGTGVKAMATGPIGNGMMGTRGLDGTTKRSKAATGQMEAILGTSMRMRCKQEGLGEGLRVVGGMGEEGII